MLDFQESFQESINCGIAEMHADYHGYTVLINTDGDGALLTVSSQDVFSKVGANPIKLVKAGKLLFKKNFNSEKEAVDFAQSKILKKIDNRKTEKNDVSKMIADAFGSEFSSKNRKELLNNLPHPIIEGLLEELREMMSEEIKEDYADNVREVLLEEMRPEVREDLNNELSEVVHNGLR